jgi:hypothetical protein
MQSIASKLRHQEHAGTPIVAFGRRLTPITRETQGSVLGLKFRLQRPVRVEIARDGAPRQAVAIPNGTARAIAVASVASAALVTLGFGVAWLIRSRGGDHSDQ